jgi:hypothetical protein
MRVFQGKMSIEVIIMTGYGTIESAIKAMKYGAYDFFLKPFNPDELINAVSRCIKHRKKQKIWHEGMDMEQLEELEINRKTSENEEVKRPEEKKDILPIIVGGLLHDMHNTLLPILGYSDLLLRDSKSIDLANSLRVIKECAERLSYMVTTLQKTVRPYYKSEGAEASKSNFKQLTQQFLSYVSSTYPGCKLTFHGLRTIPILIIPIGVSTFIISELIDFFIVVLGLNELVSWGKVP